MSSERRAGIEALLQRNVRDLLERGESGQWTILYSREDTTARRVSRFCALAPSAALTRVLAHDAWDLRIGEGRPALFESEGPDGEALARYSRFGNDDGIEPVVHVRTFGGLRRDVVELSEELRLYLDLFHDADRGRYIRIDGDGEEHVIVEYSRDHVRIRTRVIRQYLTARDMNLLTFVVATAYSDATIEDVPVDERRLAAAGDDFRYSFVVAPSEHREPTMSQVLGKRVVRPLAPGAGGIWSHDEPTKVYVDFIIGLDEEGNEVFHSCDPEGLADLFGKNPTAPSYLTPIVFKREVLKKYLDHPEKYEVADGTVRCGSLWSLDVDNQGADRVSVFLGDLGAMLGSGDQHHWRSFNIAPYEDGRDLSETARRRAFHAEFADPTALDLVFKSRLLAFQRTWETHWGWQLVRDLRAEDAHILKKLRIPVNESVVEFEEQVGGLTRLLVDSLNDSKLAGELGGALPNEKSITKLDRFLAAKSYRHRERDIAFLRLLQDARSKIAAHRKGSDYARVARALGIGQKPYSEIFSNFLQSASSMLDDLDAHFLRDASPT